MRIAARWVFMTATLIAMAGPVSAAAPTQSIWLFERQAEALIGTAINEERARFAPGTPMLAADGALNAIAQQRSEDMAEGLAGFTHVDAQGRHIAEGMIKARFGPYSHFGENILKIDGERSISAMQFARAAVVGWMNSPSHRANILDGHFDMSGIGVAVIGDHIYATQVFRGPWKSGPAKNGQVSRNYSPSKSAVER